MNFLIVILEQTISRYLSLDPEISGRLSLLSGRVISLQITEIPRVFYLFPGEHGIHIQDYCQQPVDAHIQGSATVLLRLQTGGKENKANLMKKLELSGDIELALQFSQILQQLNIDWEGLIAKYAGDTLAHYAGKVVKRFKHWQESTCSNLKANITEYLQEESKQLPTRSEVEDFFEDMTELQNDLARLEARIKQSHTHHEDANKAKKKPK